MTNAHRLARVATYLNVAEAELARMRLSWEGSLPAWTTPRSSCGAGTTGNATGGVKVLVAERHVPRARIVLAARLATPPQWRPPTWPCPRGRAEVDGLWHYCW